MYSIIITTHNRDAHLLNLLKGLQYCKEPFETIIVRMNEAKQDLSNFDDLLITQIELKNDIHQFPLALARNSGAKAARYDRLIFLDVDCIPDPDLIQDYHIQFEADETPIYMGQVYYLPPLDLSNFDFDKIRDNASKNQKRQYITEFRQEETDRRLFWTLNFGIHKNTFDKIGGFDEQFYGYGAEDTDFSFTAKQKDVPLYWFKGGKAYHQHHGGYKIPLNNFNDIVRNAQLFKDKWQIWSMVKWLEPFRDQGYISWDVDGDKITILKQPTKEEIEQARL